MSNQNATTPTTVDTSHPLGQRLKQMREKKNLSLDEVAEQTHILKRHLIALENGDFESLPQTTFARGFAVNYGRFLGLDQQIVIQSFDAQYPTSLRQKHENFEQNAPLQPMGTLQRDSRHGIKINWFIVIGAMVALGLAIFIFKTVTKAHNNNQPQEIIQEVTPQEQITGASLSNAGSTINLPNSNNLPNSGSSTIVQTTVAQPQSIQTNTTPQQGQLSTLDVWIQAPAKVNIVDATGKVLLQGDQSRGGHHLAGQLPFNVQIENANNVSMNLNKKPIKVREYTQANNQANFTLH